MSQVPPFDQSHIESLAKLLGESGSGTDITRVLEARGIKDDSGESTKWKRLYQVFLRIQEEGKSGARVLDFIQAFLAPARYVGRREEFERRRSELNVILAFAGLEYRSDGRFHQRVTATTLSEAEARLRTIRAKFKGRSLHEEVLKYCRAELMQDNYFHAVFEAAKGLAQRVRELSGVDADGSRLVDVVFAIDRPILAFNALQTETERNEHKGIANLLRGCCGAIRNPLAHGPKILWSGEEDAADYLSLISMLHRKLDGCVRTGLESH